MTVTPRSLLHHAETVESGVALLVLEVSLQSSSRGPLRRLGLLGRLNALPLLGSHVCWESQGGKARERPGRSRGATICWPIADVDLS